MVAVAENRAPDTRRSFRYKYVVPERHVEKNPHGGLPRAVKAVMGTVAGLAALGTVGLKAATYTPDKSSLLNPPGYSDQFNRSRTDTIIFTDRQRFNYIVEPGWIERNVNQPFIQADRGHFRFLREGIFNNPMVASATGDFFQYLIENKEKGNRLTLGEMLAHAIEISSKKLASIDEKNISPTVRDNLPLEATHMGLYVLAGGLSTSWWSERDLNRLGVSIKGYEDVNSFYWHTTGLGTIVFPEVYGIENEVDRHLTDYNRSPIYGGADRAVHVVPHMFIAFTYLYAKHFNLPDHQTMPNVVKLWLKIHGNGQSVDEARSLPKIIGRTYEASTTKRGIEKWFQDRSEPITEGFLDPMVALDLEANELGVALGIKLWERVRNELTMIDLITELSNPLSIINKKRPAITYSYRQEQ